LNAIAPWMTQAKKNTDASRVASPKLPEIRYT
jgi:hypothetical protein